MEGNLGEVKSLVAQHPEGLERKGLIDKEANYVMTPLSLAIYKGHLDVVRFLIEENADFGDFDHLVRIAVCNEERGDKMLEMMLDAVPESVRPDYVNAADSKGNTAVHWACLRGSSKSVEKLLEAGGTVASVNKQGQTPLMAAIWSDKNDVLELLLKNMGREGALNYMTKKQGVHHYSVETLNRIRSLDDAANYLKEDGNLALLPKIGGEVDSSVKVGIVADAPDSVSKFSATKLTNESAETKIVNCIHAADNLGNTVLHWASWRGNLEAIDLIFKAGGKLNQSNDNGETPFMVAAFNGHSNVLKYILNVISIDGINKEDYVNKKRNDGDTALVISVKEGHHEAARWLLEVAKVNQGNVHDLILFAAENNKSDAKVVEAVLDAIPDAEKADIINAVNDEGNSALHLVARKGIVDAIELLVKAGGKIYKANEEGKTPLLLAAMEGHEYAATFILDTFYDLRKCYE